MITGKTKTILVCEKCGNVVSPFYPHDFKQMKCDKCGAEMKEKKEEVIQK
jgi:hypothetical protein